MKFFVSYSGPDEKWARWLVYELENARERYQCVAQFKDFAPGENFIARMRVAAEEECTIALFSPNYFDSTYCNAELQAALVNNDNRLLPVRIEKCDPGRYLQGTIYIDLVGKHIDDARESLIRGIQAYLSQRGTRSALRPFQSKPKFPGGMSSVAPAQMPLVNKLPHTRLKVLFVGQAVGGLSPAKTLQNFKSAVAISRRGKKQNIEFASAMRAHGNELFRLLNEQRPNVFHFSGKQSGGNILMKNSDKSVVVVQDIALAGIFETLGDGLDLAIIDTCNSSRCAKLISRIVPATIGVPGDIYEDDANEYYACFYQALSMGCSLKTAAAQASSSLVLRGISKKCIPELFCRPGTDPSKIQLLHK